MARAHADGFAPSTRARARIASRSAVVSRTSSDTSRRARVLLTRRARPSRGSISFAGTSAKVLLLRLLGRSGTLPTAFAATPIESSLGVAAWRRLN